jgi:hypothetical protein
MRRPVPPSDPADRHRANALEDFGFQWVLFWRAQAVHSATQMRVLETLVYNAHGVQLIMETK